jgi:hypothetical protein
MIYIKLLPARRWSGVILGNNDNDNGAFPVCMCTLFSAHRRRFQPVYHVHDDLSLTHNRWATVISIMERMLESQVKRTARDRTSLKTPSIFSIVLSTPAAVSDTSRSPKHISLPKITALSGFAQTRLTYPPIYESY